MVLLQNNSNGKGKKNHNSRKRQKTDGRNGTKQKLPRE